MVELGDGAGFGQINVGDARFFHEFAVRHLDCHQPFELIVPCQIDQPEATFAEHAFDPITADPLRQGESFVC